MLSRWKIRTKLGLLAGVPFIALIVLASFGWNTFQQARLEGPTDRLRQNAHDTVADALPPPLYIVESYLTLHLLDSTTSTSERDALIARFQRLEAEFNQRVEFWRGNQPFPELRESILGDIKASGEEFYLRSNRDYIPAVRAGNTAVASDLLEGELRRLYDNQRAAVDVLIERSLARVESTDADAADFVQRRTTLLLVGLIVIALVTLALAALIVRSIVGSVQRLRRAAVEDLPKVIADLRTQQLEPGTRPTIAPVELGTQDELADAATSFNTVLQTAVDLAAEQAELRHRTGEIFVNLGRRNQNLVSRQLKFIDTLEERETDPELLASLFRLDHLATRMRRNAESLLVLAGVEPPRRRREPVRLTDVLRSAASEVEDFKRIAIEEAGDVRVAGEVLSPLTHMLAELMENAARFSPPDTSINVTSYFDEGALVIEVADSGMGMPPSDLARANKHLHEAYRIEEVPTAHLGLFVVARLAASLDVNVSLESPTGEGLTAVVRVPQALVASGAAPAAPKPAVTAPTPRRAAADAVTAPSTVPAEWSEPVSVAAAAETAPAAAAAVATEAEPATAPAVTATPPAAEPRSDDTPPPAAPEPAAPVVAATGFAKRVSKQAAAGAATAAPAAPAAAAIDRSADDVRNRMDRFALGKRKGVEDSTANESAPQGAEGS